MPSARNYSGSKGAGGDASLAAAAAGKNGVGEARRVTADHKADAVDADCA